MGLPVITVKPKEIYFDPKSPQIFANTVRMTSALILELCLSQIIPLAGMKGFQMLGLKRLFR